MSDEAVIRVTAQTAEDGDLILKMDPYTFAMVYSMMAVAMHVIVIGGDIDNVIRSNTSLVQIGMFRKRVEVLVGAFSPYVREELPKHGLVQREDGQ